MINLSKIAIITVFLIATTSAFANEAVIASEPYARVKSAGSDTAREKLIVIRGEKERSRHFQEWFGIYYSKQMVSL